jgi:hypothetical protein
MDEIRTNWNIPATMECRLTQKSPFHDNLTFVVAESAWLGRLVAADATLKLVVVQAEVKAEVGSRSESRERPPSPPTELEVIPDTPERSSSLSSSSSSSSASGEVVALRPSLPKGKRRATRDRDGEEPRRPIRESPAASTSFRTPSLPAPRTSSSSQSHSAPRQHRSPSLSPCSTSLTPEEIAQKQILQGMVHEEGSAPRQSSGTSQVSWAIGLNDGEIGFVRRSGQDHVEDTEGMHLRSSSYASPRDPVVGAVPSPVASTSTLASTSRKRLRASPLPSTPSSRRAPRPPRPASISPRKPARTLRLESRPLPPASTGTRPGTRTYYWLRLPNDDYGPKSKATVYSLRKQHHRVGASGVRGDTLGLTLSTAFDEAARITGWQQRDLMLVLCGDGESGDDVRWVWGFDTTYIQWRGLQEWGVESEGVIDVYHWEQAATRSWESVE